jgi:hypothetical protein
MEKNIRYMNKYLLCILLILASCGEEDALKKETVYILKENKDWLTTDEFNSGFIMIDNNKISQSFSMYQNSSDFSPSTSSYFWIKTKVIKTESYTQGFSSNYGQRFSYILTAGYSPFGDKLCVSINDILFAYDFKFNTIERISYDLNYKSKIMTDKGYEEEEKIYSKVELLDTLNVNGFLYSGILHFSFEDFDDKWTDFTVKELFIAKQCGLIKYRLCNGITYERQK